MIVERLGLPTVVVISLDVTWCSLIRITGWSVQSLSDVVIRTNSCIGAKFVRCFPTARQLWCISTFRARPGPVTLCDCPNAYERKRRRPQSLRSARRTCCFFWRPKIGTLNRFAQWFATFTCAGLKKKSPPRKLTSFCLAGKASPAASSRIPPFSSPKGLLATESVVRPSENQRLCVSFLEQLWSGVEHSRCQIEDVGWGP